MALSFQDKVQPVSSDTSGLSFADKIQPVQAQSLPQPEQSLSEKIWGGLASFGKAAISSETGFGNEAAAGIGAPAAQKQASDLNTQHQSTIQSAIKLSQQLKAAGKDSSKTDAFIKDMQAQPLHQVSDILPAVNDTNSQVIGNAGGIAMDIASAGQLETGAKAALAPKGIWQGIVQGAKSGFKAGGIIGAGQGFFKGLGGGQDVGSALESGAKGGVAGAAGGAAIGGVVGGISGGIQGAALRKQQLTDELTNNPQLVAKYSLNDSGAIVKDPNASELVRQGLPENQVAVIKNASPEDKVAFQKMIGLADNATKDARAIARPTDIVGQTIVDRTQHLMDQLKVAGEQVDTAARGLKGMQVDPSPAMQSFANDLQNIGVTFDNKGVPQFQGSDIEGIKPAENLITKVAARMDNMTGDAYQMHQLKRFLDEQVTFGKTGEGLSGQTVNIVKGLRHTIDGVLDNQSTDYNAANTSYSQAINLFDQTKSVLGSNFDPTSGTIRAGAIARRVLGNSANRGDILEYLKNLNDFYTATGGKSKGDVISQTVFADVLDSMYGTQATTGFQGGIQRGIEKAGQALEIGKKFTEGNIVGGITHLAAKGADALQGISPEAKIAALKALIGVK